MQFQGRLVTVVLDILAAVKRVRDQLLQHLGGELSVSNAERKVTLDDGPNVHLGRQVVLDDGLGRILDRLKLALYQGWWEPTVAVDIDLVDVILRVSEESQFLAGLSVLRWKHRCHVYDSRTTNGERRNKAQESKSPKCNSFYQSGNSFRYTQCPCSRM